MKANHIVANKKVQNDWLGKRQTIWLHNLQWLAKQNIDADRQYYIKHVDVLPTKTWI